MSRPCSSATRQTALSVRRADGRTSCTRAELGLEQGDQAIHLGALHRLLLGSATVRRLAFDLRQIDLAAGQ